MTTTPTLREAAQQALSDLLEAGALDRADERITVLRAALAGQAAEQAEPVVLAELYVDAGKGLVGTRSVPVKSATWNDDGSLAVRIDYWPDPPAPARQEWQPLTQTHVDYVLQYGGRCRECADWNGICPSSGLPCGGAEKAVWYVLRALNYGFKHGYITAAPAEGGAQ